jgi:hypothetical protein
MGFTEWASADATKFKNKYILFQPGYLGGWLSRRETFSPTAVEGSWDKSGQGAGPGALSAATKNVYSKLVKQTVSCTFYSSL